MAQNTQPKDVATSPPTEKSFTLRPFQPGDLGYIVHRHGLLYHQELNWGPRFKAVVARIVADFVETYEPDKECCWIAERRSESPTGELEFLGSVMLVRDRDSHSQPPEDPSSEKTAKLRLLLVEPQSRGLGLGAALIRQCTTFAREAGYSRIVLWTQSTLVAARRLYAREGYRLVKEEEHAAFGVNLTGEYWEMVL